MKGSLKECPDCKRKEYRCIQQKSLNEVVAELRKLGKDICDGCLAEFKIRYPKNPMKGCDRCPLTKFRNQIDDLFGCEKPMKDTTQRIKPLFRSSVVGSQNPKCLICGRPWVNAVDSHTRKVSEYLWKPDCECLKKDVVMSKG